ncbi:VOC family protein [Paludisphaera rhizosphaerae]|uniref:VOC family protein n=1 Tax=Paludisphaera rhizosphaerae TaxID=2711216 RepID=UPI0013EC25FA|nr:VOC family protein [Paludisphaera rhizosphaerae]
MAEAQKCGLPTITPHLVVKGGAEAIEFYKKAFGAVERMRMPWPGPDGVEKIGHAELEFGDSLVMLADEFPEHGSIAPAAGGASVVIHLMTPDVDATYAKAVEAGATAVMPPADMFWGDRYGKLVDPFGHHWSVATHIEDVSPEEMKKRMDAMMASAGEGCS